MSIKTGEIQNQLGIVGYKNANLIAVEEINRRTRFHSHKYYVVNQNSSNDLWFQPSEEPNVSWEKTHKKNY